MFNSPPNEPENTQVEEEAERCEGEEEEEMQDDEGGKRWVLDRWSSKYDVQTDEYKTKIQIECHSHVYLSDNQVRFNLMSFTSNSTLSHCKTKKNLRLRLH